MGIDQSVPVYMTLGVHKRSIMITSTVPGGVAARLREPNARRGLTALTAGYRLAFVVSLATLAISVATETAAAFVLKDAVDTAIGFAEGRPPSGILAPLASHGRLAAFAFAGILVLALALGRGVFSFISGRSGARVAEGIAKDIRDVLFDHLQRLPFHYHDGMRTGELIQRATSDVDMVRRFYGELVPGLSRIAFLFILNFIAVAILDLRLALLSSVIVPAVALVSVFFFGKIFATYDAYQDTDARSSAVLQENVTGVRVVKAFARQDYEIGKFEEANASRFTAGRKLVLLHSSYWPISHLLCAAQTLAGWVLAMGMIRNGTLSIGAFVAYTGMLGGLIWPLQNLGRLVSQLSTCSVSYTRLSEIMKEERETMGDEECADGVDQKSAEASAESPCGGTKSGLRGKIEFRDLWFAYGPPTENGQERWALKGVSFTAEPGQRIALLGAPGSGKTTLVNLIPRFYEPTRGTIVLDGRPLQDYSKAFLREAIGLVEQQPFLFSMTIRDNIAYGSKRELRDEDVRRAAAAAAIHDSISSFPEGYQTMVGERGVTLSGGQKQRLAIARTLVKDPAILLLDDSTSAVDAETEDSIRSALEKLIGTRTTFVVAHKVRTLMDADLILVFRDGEIVERGTHASLMEEGGFYRRAFDLQTRIEEDLDKELRGERSVS